MKETLILATICLLLLPQTVLADSLILSYFERPPYYYTDKGHAAGFLMELTADILRESGVVAEIKALPPNRILMEIKRPGSSHCSVGWFKKPEREEYAKFSLPIYQNKPIVILTTKKQRQRFADYSTLHEVFSDRTLIMATMSAFSYGDVIDQLLTDLRPQTHEISSEQSILPKLLLKGRVAYMLTAPEEIGMLVRSAGLNLSDFVSLPMSDIPAGNKRYLMCSKGVGDDIIDRLNRSIRILVDQDFPAL
ncbi:MAG: transporter substrate-binding domain-containing protein [Geopsychrobacter sp.]|nr:transporter substrate-binding domain-containing protein [Geopsychrobacter sp.]